MQKLRLRIIQKKSHTYQPDTSNTNTTEKSVWHVRKRIYSLLDNDVLPLAIAPVIFLMLTGLEWWRWHNSGMQPPSPVLLTIVALAMGIYCAYRLSGHKKY